MERDLKKIISEMTLEEKAGMCSGDQKRAGRRKSGCHDR